jgi:hypothetical protein
MNHLGYRYNIVGEDNFFLARTAECFSNSH